ncbi:MAG: non-ribosomal peptide synthetase [Pseudomonadota bacterium]|nr:non-ribosomal peptide synthetase [Pseudomonadota bacterium]
MNQEPHRATEVGGRRITPSKTFVEFATCKTEQSVATRFERQVEMHGDRLAIKTQKGEINYGDLNRAANQIAHAILTRLGDREEPVALLLEHGTLTVAAILGALKAGKIYVPLDPSFPLARNADIVKDAAPKLIIADHEHFALASSLAGDGAAIINIDALDTATDNPGLKLAPDRLAYILYTSGSTGQPKGVVQNHRNVLNVVMRYTNIVGLNAHDRLTLLPSASVTASVGNIFGALLNGASLFPFNVKGNVSAVLVEHLGKHDITVYQSVPAVFRHLASALNGKDLFPSLRVIRLGSAPVLKSDFDLFKEHFSADCVFINGYGASEMSTVSQYCMDRNSKIVGATVPVGYPLADTRIILLDEDRKPVEAGGIGEIVLHSHYLAVGYWRKPELTAKVFFDDPSCAGARLYLTGDVGRMLPDGCIELLGRKDFQVKIRGYRIETAEIEFALLQHGQVREVAVVACDDERGDKRLVAYVVGAGVQKEKLRAHLKARLPDYMLPSALVVLDALPLTPNGKLDRKALPRPASTRCDAVAYAPPRTPTEETLAAIYADILRLDRVGIDDNFFELGGHSLFATQVIARVNKTLNVDIQLRALFESPTVARLSALIVQSQAEALSEEELTQLLAEAQDQVSQPRKKTTKV